MTVSRVYFNVECCRDSFNLACKWFEANKPRPLSLVLLLKWNCICGRVGIVNKYLRLSFSFGRRWKKKRKQRSTEGRNETNSLCAIVFVIWFTSSKSETIFFLSWWIWNLWGYFFYSWFLLFLLRPRALLKSDETRKSFW